ncbi:hypothetical protein [Salinisphaera sp. T31B1]|uniref:hypothetical protein n=1 Tax=Salinisphaera sp. T31B1 TaxID=727963 RepID=UPI00333FE7B3
MNIQNIVADVRSRVETAGRNYQDAFKAYVDAQRKAVGVVTKNGQTLANTEIGAAKNVFAAARASFDKARADGVRKVARSPQAYVPNGRDQIVSAYKDTIDLLVRTGNELTDVVSSGYKSVLGKLGSTPASTTRTTKGKSKSVSTSARSTAAKRASGGSNGTAKRASAGTSTTTAKRKTASTRKRSSTAGTAKASSTTKSSTTAKKASPATKSAPRKRKASTKTSASQASAPAPTSNDSSSDSAS